MFLKKSRLCMKYVYYPGCTLKTKAQELERSALESAETLGIKMVEQAQWQCCGAVYPLDDKEIASRLSVARSLISAYNNDEKIVTLCSACHHLMKRINNDIKTKEEVRNKINGYLENEIPYNGQGKVAHYLEVLRDDVTFSEIKSKVKNPLTGRRIGAYYGCLLLRPQEEMNFDNVENPKIIEEFIEALGGVAVKYPYRTECCGGYLTINNKSLSDEMGDNILKSALAHEIDEIVTACPLCKYNLEGKSSKIKITYFTELLSEALGGGENE